MATRIPLVIVNGEVEQLQPGDDIIAPITGTINISLTNDESGSIVIGAPVYSDAASGVKKAKADAAGTSIVIGLVGQTTIVNAVAGDIATSGMLTFANTTQVDAIAGTTGGFTFGTRYYLSQTTAGVMSSSAPTTAGQYVVEIGTAVSTLVLKIAIQKRILL